MGLNIGPVTGALSALRAAPEFGQVRLRGEEALRPREARQRNEFEPFERRPQRDPNEVRAGFGEGTISPLAAALRTIDQTIQRVRESQPTIQEIREQFQARAAERRAEAERSGRDEAAGNALRTGELRDATQSRLIREFSATDAPNRAALVSPNEASSALGPEEIRGTRRALASQQTVESGRSERLGPDEVREERLERLREQSRAERPRFDVRV
jgi:hypothetical protein